MKRSALLFAVLASLSACGWFGGKDKVPLPGERISVLSLDRELTPDPNLAKIAITLPRPQLDKDWPEAGGYPDHAMYHLALPEALTKAWQESIGTGASDNTRILSEPVIDHGRVYAIDGRDRAGAFDAQTGKRLWQVDLKPKGQKGHSFGGGVAFWQGRLFVSTGYAQVLALDPASGKVIWRKDVAAPIYAAPTVADGRVFVVTVENELDVLAADDGRRLWSHNGLPETAGLLGGASPAVAGEVVVVAYSSGELFALTVQNGRALWSDNLAGTRGVDAVSSLADIRGRPVIDRDRVFAVSHSGRTQAIDLRTGERVWGQQIGSMHGPWVAGDYVYLLSNDNELVCLTRNEGKVRWVLQLPSWENEKKKADPIMWAGPVLGGNRLIVLSSNRQALAVSPYTGKPLGRIRIEAGSYLEPVIADDTLYILSDDGTLAAYR
ncbi:MAG TPA: PQQ-binding-like beta-propeller repeat protein [Stellaceae bacterium]|nr:PQQ-binding-like beta-propeller repeat protein [Stellaceae bacterium]